MKITRLLLLVALAAALITPAQAKIKQVTTVSAAASTLLTPGPNIKTCIIQNNGAGNVRLTVDGGTVTGLADPTATTGYKLPAGGFLVLTYPGDKRPPIIRAILETATTTIIDIVTDDAGSL